MSNLDALSRAQAARLLEMQQEARAMGEICEALVEADGLSPQPKTLERLERSRALEACIARLLGARSAAQPSKYAESETGRA